MKFRAYMNGTLHGPFTVTELCSLPGFLLETRVCPDGEDFWQPAREFPAISLRLSAGAGETFQAELPDKTESPKADSKNWREAVIPTDIPDNPSYSGNLTPPPALYAAAHRNALKDFPSTMGRRWHGTSFRRMITEQRKGILAVLGLFFVGVYLPQADNLLTIYDGLTPSPPPSASFGYRFKSGGAAHPMHPGRRAKTQIPASGGALKTAMPVTNPKRADSSSQVVEIGSENLGNGYIAKTVVVTHQRDGVKTFETKTYTVPARPLKAKKR